MKEFVSILKAYQNIGFPERRAVLTTVLRVRGSSYRSPGARMLITDDGHWFGCISGGCLEGDALRKARLVMETGVARHEVYDTTEESNQNLGISLGCHGIIDVLFEPISPGTQNTLSTLIKLGELATSIPLITKFDFSTNKVNIHTSYDNTDSIVTELVSQVISTGRSQTVQSATAIYLGEMLEPVPNLVIFGGGFDARPVVTLAHSLRWQTTVTDECVAHIAPIFFPEADALSLCSRDKASTLPALQHNSWGVLMSHNYEYDKDILRRLVHTPIRYIGMVGPRKRFEKMCAEFVAEGNPYDFSNDPRIFSPAGLDIGAEHPEEIALAIIAEIQKVMAARSGQSLRERKSPIHLRSGEEVIRG